MKLVEIFCAMFCVAIVTQSFLCGTASMTKMYLQAENTMREISRDNFIAASFRNTCHGKGFADFREWQKVCSVFCDAPELTYGIYKKAEVGTVYADVSNTKIFFAETAGAKEHGKAQRNLLYCTWESLRGKVTVIDFVDLKKSASPNGAVQEML